MNVPKILTLSFLLATSTAFAADPEPLADSSNASAPTPALPRVAEEGARNSGQQPAASSQQPRASARRGDRLDLDTTIVTGNRELPKVLYIVPWKKADIGDLPAQPFNTLLDEALTPVDRDVFRREVTYYGAMSSGADSANPASVAPAAGPEK